MLPQKNKQKAKEKSEFLPDEPTQPMNLALRSKQH